jgi:hypothetical protein
MRSFNYQWMAVAALIAVTASAEVASAASSFTNSLTGFSGDSANPATQTTVGAAGFNFANIDGLDPNFEFDRTIAFSASGANFGSLYGGDGGRNYMRTVDADYATVSFTAEITIERTSVDQQEVFIGMGGGDVALFGVPDWSTQLSSTFTSPEVNSLTTFRTSNDANVWAGDTSAITEVGIHRVRMDFNSTARTMIYSIDIDYAGGAFTADFSSPPVDLNHVDCPSGCGNPPAPISADFFGPDGWPNEPSRIYFGGDDGTLFRDFSVTVSAPPALTGDYNGNNTIDAADYTVWRDSLGTAGPLPNDPTPGTIDASDLQYWKDHFGDSLGSGGLAGGAAVPEPATCISVSIAVAGLAFVRTRP